MLPGGSCSTATSGRLPRKIGRAKGHGKSAGQNACRAEERGHDCRSVKEGESRQSSEEYEYSAECKTMVRAQIRCRRLKAQCRVERACAPRGDAGGSVIVR